MHESGDGFAERLLAASRAGRRLVCEGAEVDAAQVRAACLSVTRLGRAG